MADNYEFECWAYISKRGDSFQGRLYDKKQFKKRKKRWITITDDVLIYSKSEKRTDMKYVQLEHVTAIKSYNDSNLETMVSLMDSQTRTIEAVLEPDNFNRDVPLLLAALLSACNCKRRKLTHQAILSNDIVGLKDILAYFTVTEAILQDVNYSASGTPLHFVTQNPKHAACLPFLVDRDALTISANKQGLLPIHTAVLTGSLELLHRLVEVASWPQERGGGDLTPVSLVNLRTCAGITNDGAFDRTPLHISTDEEVTAFLIKHGARLEDQDSEGNTPLLVACEKCLYLHAIELLDSGASVNQSNWSTGVTPIMNVANFNNIKGNICDNCIPEEDIHGLFNDLLDRGADCAVLDNKNMSSLHYACKSGDLTLSSALLNVGVELDGQNSDGATPLCLAASCKRIAPGVSSHELCGLLIAKGSYPRIRDKHGRQALHYAAGAGNPLTLSLLLEVSESQDINTPCFRGFTALDYVNNILPLLDGLEESERLAFLDGLDVIIPGPTDVKGRELLRKKYFDCQTILKNHGAVDRIKSDISVEQNCRDMTFLMESNGSYSIAASTPYALLLRLTSFVFYSKESAIDMLLTYKNYIHPLELLTLLKIRFYFLTHLPAKALALCNDSTFRKGVTLCDNEHIILHLMSLKNDNDCSNFDDEKMKIGRTSSVSSEDGGLSVSQRDIVDGMERNSLKRVKNYLYIKGVDTTIVPSSDEDEYIVQNSCVGKTIEGDELLIFDKFLTCMKKCFDSVEMVSTSLVLRLSGRFFILDNVTVSVDFKKSTSWTCRLICDQSQPPFHLPGTTSKQAVCKMKAITLRCIPAHKMMRGKSVFALQMSFMDPAAKSIQLEEDAVFAIKDEVCLTCAKVLYGIACDAFSPDIPLMRSAPLLTSKKSTVDILEEASAIQRRGEMEALPCCHHQMSKLERQYQRQGAEGALGGHSASLNAFLQLLSLWCKGFYEDDFEHDDSFRYDMGSFVEEVFQVCGPVIENEMDPNTFSSFIGLEKPSQESAVLKENSLPTPPQAIVQNKRGSAAFRQSKRLSSKGIIETPPMLRGGMYENLYFFNLKSFFGESGTPMPRTSNFSVLSSTPMVIAEQWTLMEHYLYCKVRHSDFLNIEDGGTSTSLAHMKKFQAHMVNWCISQIIDSATLDNARLKMSFFLDVSTHMESFRNFNGMFEIFSVIYATSITRLRGAWDTLNKSSQQRRDYLKDLFDPMDEHAKFKCYVENISDILDKPTVPFLNLYVRDLMAVNEINTTECGREGVINMAKMNSLSSKLNYLHSFQLIAYRIGPDFPIISSVFSPPKFGNDAEQLEKSMSLCPEDAF